MAQEQRLELKLSQKLILTPQLQQSIKLLQLPLLELSQNITQELINNPMLEEVTEIEQDRRDGLSSESIEEESGQESPDDIEAPLEKMFGFTTDSYFEERQSDGRDLGYFNPGQETPSFERNTKRPDLYEHLLWQLRLSHVSQPVGRAAEAIINNLNEDGYLLASLDEISRIVQVDDRTIEEALSLVQNFDPSGVGARNLQECLLLQLKPLDLRNSIVEKIITDGFQELEKKRYRQLASKFRTSIEEIIKAIEIIEGLEPRPGRNYTSDEPVHIIPDVYIEESDGKFIILLNDEGIPKIRLSNYYRKLLAHKKSLTQEERQFLEEKLRSALWLLKSLEQRNRTIYRATESILRFQEEFFRKGFKYLKPLNLKDVADDLGMHESTISRVTSNKYLQCPQGLLSFRFFFSNAVTSTEGSISSATVKNAIRQFIAEEDPRKPYSDKEIVEMLNSKGIKVARRTVAKYRDELKIPPHNRRKKWV